MTLEADPLIEAHTQLQDFSRRVPTLFSSFQHQLKLFFPALATDLSISTVYLTYQAEVDEPGQNGAVVSHALIDAIRERYLTGEVPAYFKAPLLAFRAPYSTDTAHLISQMPICEVENFVDYVVKHHESCLSNTLTHFWQTTRPELEDRSPRNWLGRFYMGLVQAEQSSRKRDETLTTLESDALVEVLTTSVARPRKFRAGEHYLGVYEVVVKAGGNEPDWPLSGAFVVTEGMTTGFDDTSDTFQIPLFAPTLAQASVALLYLPDSGLQSFSSLQALDLELRLRLGDDIQRRSLLNQLPTQQRQDLSDNANSLGYREIQQHAFKRCIEALINRQLADIPHACNSATANAQATTLDELDDYLADALAVTRYLKPAAIAQNRYTHLFEKRLPDWLTAAPTTQKNRWRLAVARLSRETSLSLAPGIPRTEHNGNKTYLLTFARDRLKKRIAQDLKIDVDPNTITLVTTEILQTGPIIHPLGTSGFAAGNSLSRTGPTLTSHSIRRSLPELALENVGKLDLTFALTATVLDKDGKHHPTLTSAYLKSIVRELDISRAYKTFLQETLLTSDAASWRRERYGILRTAQLRLDTLEARLSGQLTHQQADWVDLLLDDNTADIKAAKISTQLLMLRYKTVPGLLLIACEGHAQQLCYLPEAPDRVWFRTFNTLNELASQLSLRALRDYVLQRITPLEQAYINPLLKEGLTDFNTQTQAITGHFLGASYDAEAAFALRNADEQSTSTREANIQTIKDTTMTLVDVISFALPLKVLVPLTMMRFGYAVYRGTDALRREQENEALQHFAGSIAHLTDAASDFAGSRVFSASIRLRTSQLPRAFSPASASLKTPKNMTLRVGERFGQGVYEWTDGTRIEYYLPDARGHFYHASYDRTHNEWLMTDRRMPEAYYKTPATEIMGKWEASGSTPLSRQKTGIDALLARARVVDIEIPTDLLDTQGVFTQNNRHFIQQNEMFFEVSTDTPGPDMHLVLSSGSQPGQPVYKVRRNLINNEWEIKHTPTGDTARWQSLKPQGAHSTSPLDPEHPYELPRKHLARAAVVMSSNSRYQDPLTGTFRDPEVEQTRMLFYQMRQRLIRDAKTFFTAEQPISRPAIPQLAPSASHATLLRQVYAQSPGLVIGENHYSIASKKFLIDNMPELVKNDVKTIYLEHLQRDLHQVDLDNYNQHGVISHSLNKYLKNLYKRDGLDSEAAYTFLTIVTTARRHRIKVQAIDCAASYHMYQLGREDYAIRRAETMNYYSTRVMREHQAKQGAHKWVALVGFTHTNTFEGVLGLAELNGAIGLKVMDTLVGQPTGTGLDKGRLAFLGNGNHDGSFFKSDLRLSMEVAASRTTFLPPQRQQIDHLLSLPDQYTFTNDPTDGATLFHRNANSELIETSVLSDPDRKIYVQRPEWPEIHEKRFTHAKNLIKALNDKGLILIK